MGIFLSISGVSLGKCLIHFSVTVLIFSLVPPNCRGARPFAQARRSTWRFAPCTYDLFASLTIRLIIIRETYSLLARAAVLKKNTLISKSISLSLTLGSRFIMRTRAGRTFLGEGAINVSKHLSVKKKVYQISVSVPHLGPMCLVGLQWLIM